MGCSSRLEAGERPPRPRRVRKCSGKRQGAAPRTRDQRAAFLWLVHIHRIQGLTLGPARRDSLGSTTTTSTSDYYFLANIQPQHPTTTSSPTTCSGSPTSTCWPRAASGDLSAAAYSLTHLRCAALRSVRAPNSKKRLPFPVLGWFRARVSVCGGPGECLSAAFSKKNPSLMLVRMQSTESEK